MKNKVLIIFLAAITSFTVLNAQEKELMPSAKVKLNSGYEMPILGLGTWTLKGETCVSAVYTALKEGYRLIDTARYYGNEAEVGQGITKALSEGICRREDIFVTTKLFPWSTTPESDIENSLKNLNLEYLDLVLLHQHGNNDDKVYHAMERGGKNKKIRSIGISNFYTEKSVNHFIKDFEIIPSVIQNENHQYYQNNSLRNYVSQYGIFIESYYPFGGRGNTKKHYTDPVVTKLAKAHNKTSAQIILRWHLQANYIVIPGSSDPHHIAENFDIFDFNLTNDEMKQMLALDKQLRYETW